MRPENPGNDRVYNYERSYNLMKRVYLLKAISLVFLSLLLLLLLFRFFSSKQLDDVSPNIPCDQKLLESSDILFVIPKFENTSISTKQDWCKSILALNKTLAIHGVYHSYNEFGEDRSEEYLLEGIEEFYNCFGFYPQIFKAPQLKITPLNKKLVKNKLTFYGYPNQLVHKTYHCNDSGEITNKITNLI